MIRKTDRRSCHPNPWQKRDAERRPGCHDLRREVQIYEAPCKHCTHHEALNETVTGGAHPPVLLHVSHTQLAEVDIRTGDHAPLAYLLKPLGD